MRNVIEIDGQKALVSLDPEIKLFRGEFLGLSGGADFYADTVEKLFNEGRRPLKAYLDLCREKRIEPYRKFSGRFNVRLDPETHEAAVVAAASEDKSLSEWIAATIESAARAA